MWKIICCRITVVNSDYSDRSLPAHSLRACCSRSWSRCWRLEWKWDYLQFFWLGIASFTTQVSLINPNFCLRMVSRFQVSKTNRLLHVIRPAVDLFWPYIKDQRSLLLHIVQPEAKDRPKIKNQRLKIIDQRLLHVIHPAINLDRRETRHIQPQIEVFFGELVTSVMDSLERDFDKIR